MNLNKIEIQELEAWLIENARYDDLSLIKTIATCLENKIMIHSIVASKYMGIVNEFKNYKGKQNETYLF